jgi:hypothetical protein
MFPHPAITAALADQHRRDLAAQAAADGLARAVRHGTPGQPGLGSTVSRPAAVMKIAKRSVPAAVAAVAAATLLAASSAESAHVFRGQSSPQHVYARPAYAGHGHFKHHFGQMV